jgi:hypothetical protein
MVAQYELATDSTNKVQIVGNAASIRGATAVIRDGGDSEGMAAIPCT